MTQNEINTFTPESKGRGSDKRRYITGRTSLSKKTADEFDEITIAFERDIAVQHLDRESHLLQPDFGRAMAYEGRHPRNVLAL